MSKILPTTKVEERACPKVGKWVSHGYFYSFQVAHFS